MHDSWLFVVSFVAISVVSIGFMLFNPTAVLKRKLRKVPVSHIGSLSTGAQARITGTIAPDNLSLTSPFMQKQCAWYRTTVEEYRSHGKSSSWQQIVKEEQFTDFVLSDVTGRCRVHMQRPSVASNADIQSKSGTFDDATTAEDAFLQRHGLSSVGLLGMNRRLRYTEMVLEVGESVTVLGRAGASSVGTITFEPDPELGLLLSDDPSTLT